MQRPLPTPSPLEQPYFDGCREGELRLQTCNHCHRAQFYPRVLCSHCGHDDLSWQPASGLGVVASFTVARRAVSQAFEAPYVIALIDLEEGVRLMSHVVDVDPDAVTVGLPVTVAFEAWSEDVTMPIFKPR